MFIMDAPKLIASYYVVTLEKDIVDERGKVIARAGQTVIALPQTVAEAVMVSNKKSLKDLLPELSKTDHAHEDY